VLFLCVHNAGRSQMAAGFLRHLAGDTIDVFSGGSDPGTQVNAAAIEAMNEVGIDISTEYPKPWTDEIARAADVIVTMGCGDACPIFPGKRYEDWELADPAGQSVEFVRDVRDDIRSRVEPLIASLQVSASPVVGPEAGRREPEPAVYSPMVAARRPPSAALGIFGRFLTLWVAVAIVVGVAVGQWFPGVPDTLSRYEYASVSVPVAILIWAMIFPMMVQIDLGSIVGVRREPRGLVVTTVVNWLIKPFTMFAISWFFLLVVFSVVHRRAAGARVPGGCDPARCRTVHGDGVRVEPAHQGRPGVHARAGLAERPDHAGGVRADRGVPAGRVRHHGAVGHRRALGGALHRHPAARRVRRSASGCCARRARSGSTTSS
jgi:arsenate reductase (thioredoxin)